MEDDLQRIAKALHVPLGWLLGFVVLSFAALLAAVVTRSHAAGVLAAACGLGLALLGVRAAIRPSRPFRLEHLSNSPWISTTRRLGAFYVIAGVTDAALALVAATSSAPPPGP